MRAYISLLILALALLPVPGAAQSLNTLYGFGGGAAGANPSAGVILGTGGALFGTTPYGGAHGYGSVYQLTPPSGSGWQPSVIYGFKGAPDGANPGAALTLGSGGVFYGTTFGGGVSGNGTVFQLTPPSGAGAWTETVLYSFNGGSDGSGPLGTLYLDSTGILYGTTFGGGAGAAGTVFTLTPPAGGVGSWSEAVIYSFTGARGGSGPESGVIKVKKAFYGTTCCGTEGGTVYVLRQSNGVWARHPVYAFLDKANGSHPFGGLAADANGVLYGTTVEGGASGTGTVFSLTPPATVGNLYTLTTIHSFTNGVDGGAPYGSTLLGPNGVLFVTATVGCNSGVGGVLQFTPPAGGAGTWTEAILHSFTGGSDGSQPFAGVVADGSNNLYGTTVFGGASQYGTVFELTP